MTMPAELPNSDSLRIAVIGLGYVGLPLAVEFAQKLPVVGFDVALSRIAELSEGHDRTTEVSSAELAQATNLQLTSDIQDLNGCNVYIVTVPTPIDRFNRPDLGPLLAASKSVGQVLDRGDVVIYESTVYPGATEQDCVPILEAESGLRFNRDFFAGYSPERINPGDKIHRLPEIVKVTSGSTPKAANFVDELYKKIITAGTHKAASIQVAEAAKVIENTQRDVNIALVNELALIFDKLDIDTSAVLEAAGTKWNFLPFRPGLVGGHCIGVDPYYLTHKAQEVGHHAEVVLSGRRINDSMGAFVANRLVREMINRDLPIKGARILVMGLTFKENCPDLRNSRVIDVIEELEAFGAQVDVCDPCADPQEALAQQGRRLIAPEAGIYDAIALCVAHDEFRDMGSENIRALGKIDHVIYDLKSILPRAESDLRL